MPEPISFLVKTKTLLLRTLEDIGMEANSNVVTSKMTCSMVRYCFRTKRDVVYIDADASPRMKQL